MTALTWLLDPEITFLNHGSFGSCPKEVHDVAQGFRERFEREPVRFVLRELEQLLDETRTYVGEFLGADPEGLVFVPNATTGVNAVMASLSLEAGDELLVTDHAYNACRNAVEYHAERLRARVVVARVPFPLTDEDEILSAVLSAVTPRTRFAMLDHVTSQTALLFPVRRLVQELEARGIDTLVDGAHAPGMIPVNVRELGATYYAANFHKWCCAPKGAGVLHVRADRRARVRPHVISHGANANRADRSKFHLEFDWTGTLDPSPVLSIPSALELLSRAHPSGISGVRHRNHELAVAARRIITTRLQISVPCPDAMLGSMASIPLPSDLNANPTRGEIMSPLYEALFTKHRIEVPIFPWPTPNARVLRISAHLYNEPTQYERLCDALSTELAAEQSV